MAAPALSIIIPAFNEADRLPATLRAVDDYIAHAPFAVEVIVVDDGSTDDTRAIALAHASSRAGHSVLGGGANRGKGYAVRTGMLGARGERRLFLDADNSTSPEQTGALLPWFDRGYDVVIGSRAVRGAVLEPRQSALKHWLGKGGNLLIQAVVLPGIWDTQCGFKCFSERAAVEIFSRATVDGWAFDVEALALARTLGYRIKEVPVRWVNDSRSGVTWSDYPATLRDVFRIGRSVRRRQRL